MHHMEIVSIQYSLLSVAREARSRGGGRWSKLYGVYSCIPGSTAITGRDKSAIQWGRCDS